MVQSQDIPGDEFADGEGMRGGTRGLDVLEDIGTDENYAHDSCHLRCTQGADLWTLVTIKCLSLRRTSSGDMRTAEAS